MYYIKGNSKRGAEVIALLESKGGVNGYNFKGDEHNAIFYIDKEGYIKCAQSLTVQVVIVGLCEELTLPEKWEPKFKVGDEVTHSVCGGHGVIKDIVDTDNCPHCYIVKDDDDKEFLHPWYESETELYKWTPKRGETVLVRNCDNWDWEEAVFSFQHIYPNGKIEYHTIGGNNWEYCIPFDESKLGKVTEE